MEGHSNREIAASLGMSEQIVKNHIRAMMDDTGMGNRLELALWYVKKQEDREC